MTKYAEGTTVSIARSRAEIEDLLARHNATGFLYGEQAERAMIAFELAGRRYRMMLHYPPLAKPLAKRQSRTRKEGQAMTKKQAALCLAPTGKGLPTSTSSPSDTTISEEKCQFLHQNERRRNHFLTACQADSEMSAPVVVRKVDRQSLTETSSKNNGQMSQFPSRFAQEVDERPYAPLDPYALAVLEQLAMEVGA